MLSSGSAATDTVFSTSSSDPFLLEFGSSVSVNEDLSRELHKSCQGLDASMQHTNQEIQRAIRTDSLLKKDLGHATAEMTRLARDCTEEVDAITINRHTRSHLMHQFQTSFIRIVDPQRFHANNNNDEEKEENPSAEEAKGDKNVVCTFVQVLSNNQMMLQNKILVSNRTNNQKLSEIRSDLNEISQNCVSVEERISLSEKARDVAQTEKHSRSKELNVETQRQMSIKDACHRSRHRCGECAKELVELDKLYCIKQKAYKAEQEDLTQSIARVEEEIHDFESKELSALDMTLSAATAEMEELQNQINLANDIRERRAKVKLQRDAMNFVVITTEKEQQLLEEAQARLSDSVALLDKVKQEEEELASLRATNDNRETGQIARALLHRVTLGKDNEVCAGKINELHRERNALDAHHSDLVAIKKSEVASIEAKYQSLKEEISMNQKQRYDYEKKHEALLVSHQKEMESHESFISSLENTIQMEEEKRMDTLQEREAEMDEKVAKYMQKNSKIRQKAEYKLSVLHKGEEILQSTEKMYQEITNKPIDEITFSRQD